MSQNREFAEILSRKMGKSQATGPATPQIPRPNPVFVSFEHPLDIPQFTWSPSSIPSQYPKSQPKVQSTTEKSSPSPSQTFQAEPSFRLGELGLELSTPFMVLIHSGADLREDQLSLSQLKREYRKLALKHHPDVCKVANSKEIFQECTRAYRELRQAIEKHTKN